MRSIGGNIVKVILLKDLAEDCVDAVIISKTSTAKDIERNLKKMRRNIEFPEWDDYVNCLPKDCVLYDRWGNLEEVYY